MKYEVYYKNFLGQIEKTLEKLLPANSQCPPLIHEAMRYAVFPAGKRFRPVLVLAACEAAGGKPEEGLLAGASLELIHSYSLVHDDLPALDNDELRRGVPTCHKRFGEDIAILAGDGLLTLALQILARARPAERAVRLLDEISTAAGTYGMIGGQVADIKTPRENLNLPMIDYISSHKTGKLIKSSAVCGAICAGASKDVLAKMSKYGECLGLAFQFVDDYLDGDGYMKLIKATEIRSKVRDLIACAKREIKPLGRKGEKLIALADFLLRRMPRGSYVALDK